jgi:predicted esterase
VKRREFLKISAAAGLAACSSPEDPDISLERATITARPMPFSGTAPRGFHRFGIWQKDDAYIYVPPTYSDGTPAPLLVLLHGAGGRASNFEANLPGRVDDKGIVVVAFDSSLPTWDRFSLGGFGPDVERMNIALDYAFRRVNGDPDRVGLAGFSDGASYAIGLALANGDLFTKAIAFSPGLIPNSDSPPVGKPAFFDSHGVNDQVLSIDNASRRIVPEL